MEMSDTQWEQAVDKMLVYMTAWYTNGKQNIDATKAQQGKTKEAWARWRKKPQSWSSEKWS